MDWFAERLLRWAKVHGRKNLPWQQDSTPYHVWVSEIMLQQTQVKSVINYYERFIKRFPTLSDLANASEHEVLQQWSGLGYYRRARNLHKCAQTIRDEHHGKFPDSLEILKKLPGIGASTAGAILSLGFNSRGTIMDGNVRRVLARIHGITEPVNQSSTERKLWDLAQSHTPHSRHAEYAQAIMDFGATWCTKHDPMCSECTMQTECIAFRIKKVQDLPFSLKRSRPREENLDLLLITDSLGFVLLEQRPPEGLWSSLWLPPHKSKKTPIESLLQGFGLPYNDQIVSRELEKFEHTLSHIKFTVSADVLKLGVKHTELAPNPRIRWCNADNIQDLAVPALTNKLIAAVNSKANLS